MMHDGIHNRCIPEISERTESRINATKKQTREKREIEESLLFYPVLLQKHSMLHM